MVTGASASYPENTLESFRAAIKHGSHGLESDVHLTSDNVILMFHDPRLERTTDGTGEIAKQPYHNGIDAVRTKKEPHLPIPTFQQVLELLDEPEHSDVIFNIDVKPQNAPNTLFKLMRTAITSFPDWETRLAPRLVLGLWHPRYIEPSKAILPELKRAHIGMSTAIARQYFFKDCHGFSMHFASLITSDGQRFLRECRAAGKETMVWTVNTRNEWIEAVKWGVSAILTDKTSEFLSARKEMEQDWHRISKESDSFLFSWTSISYFSAYQKILSALHMRHLKKLSGPLKLPVETI